MSFSSSCLWAVQVSFKWYIPKHDPISVFLLAIQPLVNKNSQALRTHKRWRDLRSYNQLWFLCLWKHHMRRDTVKCSYFSSIIVLGWFCLSVRGMEYVTLNLREYLLRSWTDFSEFQFLLWFTESRATQINLPTVMDLQKKKKKKQYKERVPLLILGHPSTKILRIFF